jgi:uncharacterized protein (TIGR02757 family)
VVGRHRPTPALPQHLEQLYRAFPFDRSLADDPLSMVRPHAANRRAAETAGLFAAILAIGNTTAIRRSFGELERRIGHDWVGFVDHADAPATARRLQGFRHRWIRDDQLLHLARRLQLLRREGRELESIFLEGLGTEGDAAGGLHALSKALRGPGDDELGVPPRGYLALFPSPRSPGHSPCKRLALYTRWMVRTDYPDLGLWRRVDPAHLRIPLDQHVYWIAYHLGLTARKTRSWAAAEEITAALRTVDPVDPVRFDFVLCHTGISGDCPKHRDLSVCGPCVVRPDCRLWRGRRAA